MQVAMPSPVISPTWAPVVYVMLMIASLVTPSPAMAWGDEGHQIVALIAYHFLAPPIRTKVDALLEADTDSLTQHDIAHEATWADKYRDSDRRTKKERYNATSKWHFVDIELVGLRQGDINAACAHECSVSKIPEFAAILHASGTPPEERLFALKFLLHLVGDIHQPLHDANNHNSGGNAVRVTAEGFRAGNLHHFWDTEFVRAIEAGRTPEATAAELVENIGITDLARWRRGTARTWALESFSALQHDPYMGLSHQDQAGSHRLDAKYIATSVATVEFKLKEAGVRLAAVLDEALK